MENGGHLTRLYVICDWIARLAYINLLWIGFSVAGFILFGLMPATAAMFTIIRKWIKGENDFTILQTFWQTYKTEFLKSNALGGILMTIGGLIFLDLRISQSGTTAFSLVMSLLMISGLFILFIMFLYVWPIFVHFNLSIFNILKTAFILSISQPMFTIIMIVGSLAVYFIMMNIPGLIPFFGGSLLAFIMMWSSSLCFNKIMKDSN
ncbi:YesL family protein [Mesobacillus foraminis]|uniref:YesL family protein n=1 Tax=Mesobacillus foraminis TaxID=279826 RepID=UPI001BE70E37|nr:YesL family protein [Mesobacillus foraminis]MBT2758159.1 YesL family protein [Mesobacillus foraminis]